MARRRKALIARGSPVSKFGGESPSDEVLSSSEVSLSMCLGAAIRRPGSLSICPTPVWPMPLALILAGPRTRFGGGSSFAFPFAFCFVNIVVGTASR